MTDGSDRFETLSCVHNQHAQEHWGLSLEASNSAVIFSGFYFWVLVLGSTVPLGDAIGKEKKKGAEQSCLLVFLVGYANSLFCLTRWLAELLSTETRLVLGRPRVLIFFFSSLASFYFHIHSLDYNQICFFYFFKLKISEIKCLYFFS